MKAKRPTTAPAARGGGGGARHCKEYGRREVVVGSASGCGSAGRVRPATAAPRSGEARRGGGRPRNTHAVVAELVQLKQQQSALTKQVDVVVRDQIKAHRAELNQLLDSLPRKANDNVVWKAMETKATVVSPWRRAMVRAQMSS